MKKVRKPFQQRHDHFGGHHQHNPFQHAQNQRNKGGFHGVRNMVFVFKNVYLCLAVYASNEGPLQHPTLKTLFNIVEAWFYFIFLLLMSVLYDNVEMDQ